MFIMCFLHLCVCACKLIWTRVVLLKPGRNGQTDRRCCTYCGRLTEGHIKLIFNICLPLHSTVVAYHTLCRDAGFICEHAIAYVIAHFAKICISHIFPHIIAFSKSHMRKLCHMRKFAYLHTSPHMRSHFQHFCAFVS